MLSQIRWLMTIRTPAKVFFQVIVPPILLIAGLSILRGSKDKETSAASGPQPLELTPDLYLKPGSNADYATNALLQNSTNHAMGYVMAYLAQYSVGTALVSSIKSVLSSSSHALYNLGFNIREFPADSNLLQPSVSMFSLTKLTAVIRAISHNFYFLQNSNYMRPNFLVCMSGRFQWRIEQHFPQFPEKGKTNLTKFSKISTGNFCSF